MHLKLRDFLIAWHLNQWRLAQISFPILEFVLALYRTAIGTQEAENIRPSNAC